MNASAQPRDVATAAACRTSRGLFAACGELSVAGVDPGAAVALNRMSGRFAWHAELLYDLLPVRAGIDRESLVGLAAPGADGVVAHVEAASASRDVATACTVLLRVVLPRAVADATRSMSASTEAFDGPRHRAMGLIARDLSALIEDLAPLVERLLADPAARASALGVAARCESELAGAGIDGGLVAASGDRGG